MDLLLRLQADQLAVPVVRPSVERRDDGARCGVLPGGRRWGVELVADVAERWRPGLEVEPTAAGPGRRGLRPVASRVERSRAWAED